MNRKKEFLCLADQMIGHRSVDISRITLFCLLTAMWMLGCTDVELITATDPKYNKELNNLVEVSGKVCTVEPAPVLYPYKILFIIDVSGSNAETDPDDNRARAVQQVIEDYIENRAISFGVVTFESEAQVQLMHFTRDYDSLVPGVVDSLRKADGATNYLGALSEAFDFIEKDILKTNESMRHRTRYDIHWLSDGIPQPCISIESAVNGVSNILDLEEHYGLFDVKFNTVQLMGGAPDECPEGSQQDFLESMAKVGRGTFQQMSSDELEFTIRFTEIFRAFEHRNFYLINENRIIWANKLLSDSDGDGLYDENKDPDPLVADFNRDGCSDRVDEQMSPANDVCASFCDEEMGELNVDWTGLPDKDKDGIPDCAEKVLGFNWAKKDTDQDGFPDWVELRFGTSATGGQPFDEDSDRDGITDGDEIYSGTNPHYPENAETRALYSYNYHALTPVESHLEGSSCFEFKVDNVRLVETKETPHSQPGTNRLCLYFSQTQIDDPDSEMTFTVACQNATYRSKGTRETLLPPNGKVTFQPSDFNTETVGLPGTGQ